MSKCENILAITLARGGSKKLSRKNIAMLEGRPLISYTIKAAQQSKNITRFIVSTDDNEIADIAKSCGSEVLRRPSALAQDCSPIDDSILHCLNVLKLKEQYSSDVLVVLPPTSPLRDYHHIDDAFELFRKNTSQAVISVCEPSHHPLKSFKINDNGFIKGLVNNKNLFLPRQQLPKVLVPNGAIFIIKTNTFNRYKALLPPKTIPYIMSKLHSVDVDDIDDLNYAAYLMKKQFICV